MDFLNLNQNVNSTNDTVFLLTNTDVASGDADDEEYINTDCINAQSMNFIQFFGCFKYFLSKSILVSSLVLLFSISTAILNIIVIIFINRLKRYKTVFDKIFIAHAFVDFLVGLLVIPNYCIYTMFGYWPLGKFLCHFYVSLDYTLCHVGILHMLFIAYARLRSLLSPKRYHQEFLISHTTLSIVGLWIISALLWLPAVNLIINLSFRDRECYFTFHPVYIIIQDTVAYLTPMFIILGITGFILHTLHKTNKRRKNMRKKKRKIKSGIKFNDQIQKKLVSTSEGKAKQESSSYAYSIVYLKDTDGLSLSAGSTTNSEMAEDKLHSVIVNNNSDESPEKQQQQQLKTPTSPTIIRLNSKSLTNVRNPRAFILPKTNKTADNNNKFFSKQESKLSLGVSNNESSFCTTKSFHSINSIDENVNVVNGNNKNRSCLNRIRKKLPRLKIRLNAYAKLYVIMATFCLLWLPFCILWPIGSICPNCISQVTYQISYWMGYAQSLINPILLLILNPNYNKLKVEN